MFVHIEASSSHSSQHVKPWPNDSIFHSIFLSTFDLKIERSRAWVAKRFDFLLDFSLDFFTPRWLLTATSRGKTFDSLDKVAKRFDFHSTTPFSLDFFDRDQTSLNIIRRRSTRSTRWPNESIFHSILFGNIAMVQIHIFYGGLLCKN